MGEKREPDNGDTLSEHTDEELAIAAKLGTTEARNMLFLRHRSRIARLTERAKRITRRQGYIEPQDVDQQSFIIFCELVRSWEPERTPFVPYMSKMMPWQALHYVRSLFGYRNKSNTALWLDDEENAWRSLEYKEAERLTEETESRFAMQSRTNSLREAWRTTVNLRFNHGLSSRQIAQMSGRSRRAIDRELRAAMLVMRGDAQEQWEEEH